jgi:excisionase family DNA binding protein
MQGFLTTQEAAEKLGVTAGRVRQMIIHGQLPATKLGRDNIINETDLSLVEDRKVGRPPKDKDSSKKKQSRARKLTKRQRM